MTIGGRRVAGVGVQAGHDTRIRVGVLHVHASDGTRIDLLEPANGETLASGYGERSYGLPVGPVAVEVARQQEIALIEDGKVTALRSLGRLVVAYPEDVAARIDVFRAGETRALASAYGDQAFDLFPGTYDVSISGKRVAGVTVGSGHDTQIEVGVLRVNVSDGTRIDLIDPVSNAPVASAYGTQVVRFADRRGRRADRGPDRNRRDRGGTGYGVLRAAASRPIRVTHRRKTMRTTSCWLLSLALAVVTVAAPIGDAAGQPRPTSPGRATTPPTPAAPGRTTAPPASSEPGLSSSTAVTTAAAIKLYTLPTITYGEPMPPPIMSSRFDAPIPRFETVSVAATVNGRSVNRQLVVLNGRQGIESAAIDDRAKRLIGMHVRKLNLSESTVYFFDAQVAAEWLAAHRVDDEIGPEEEEDDDNDGGSGCGFQNLGNCAEDPVGAVQDGVDAVEAEFERLRDRAEDNWNDSVEALADEWDEALNCFSDHVLPGGTVPVRFDITPTMTVNLSQSGSRGSGTGSATGSVGLGIPMDGDLQAKVDFFYIPCLPFVVRPRSITVTGDLTVGEQLAINATASGEFNKRYTIPPTGGPRIPIQVIPIVIGGVPVAVIDVSAYIEGEVEVAASGNVTSNFTLSNEHTTTFDFTCSGQGCRTGSGARPTASTPVTTTESVQVEGKVSAKPGIYTALMFTLNVNVLSARLGPQPYLLGTAAGCGAATATQTNGGDSTGQQNARIDRRSRLGRLLSR